ncbi:hypothetical protein B0H14DRAFT_2587631 [Mycena olivaceomarginata]|nr:hypothetical protein B0H14DRAFT_2587631 [Mycena olivaceomarginata]
MKLNQLLQYRNSKSSRPPLLPTPAALRTLYQCPVHLPSGQLLRVASEIRQRQIRTGLGKNEGVNLRPLWMLVTLSAADGDSVNCEANIVTIILALSFSSLSDWGVAAVTASNHGGADGIFSASLFGRAGLEGFLDDEDERAMWTTMLWAPQEVTVSEMALARLEKDEMSSAQPSELKSMDGLDMYERVSVPTASMRKTRTTNEMCEEGKRAWESSTKRDRVLKKQLAAHEATYRQGGWKHKDTRYRE